MTVRQAFFFPNLSQNGEVIPLQGKGLALGRHILKTTQKIPGKTDIHPSMVPSSTIPSSSTCGPATPNIPVTSWLASGIGVRLSWSKMKTFWSVGILASWHLWGGISKQKETVGVQAGVFLFKWQCLVTVGLIFFHEAKMRWELKNGRTSSVFHDSPTPWQPQGVASNVLLDHLDSWPTPSCSSQKSRSTPGRARFLGSGGADVVVLPRIFGGIAGESLLGGWKTSHFLKKMGATTICQQTPRSYHFWAHFWGIENSKPQNGHFLVEIGDFKTSISFTIYQETWRVADWLASDPH